MWILAKKNKSFQKVYKATPHTWDVSSRSHDLPLRLKLQLTLESLGPFALEEVKSLESKSYDPQIHNEDPQRNKQEQSYQNLSADHPSATEGPEAPWLGSSLPSAPSQPRLCF